MFLDKKARVAIKLYKSLDNTASNPDNCEAKRGLYAKYRDMMAVNPKTAACISYHLKGKTNK